MHGDTVISTLFCCVGVSGQSGNELVYTVTITAIPNTTTYSVGDLVTLMCMVDPPYVNVTYSWLCNDCFADGMTNMTIVGNLTEMDNTMIYCSATNYNNTFTTIVSFDLQVTRGRVVSFWPNKNHIM